MRPLTSSTASSSHDFTSHDSTSHGLRSRIRGWVFGGWRRLRAIAQAAIENTIIYLLVQGPRRLIVAFYRYRRARGEPIFVEDLPNSRVLSPSERERASSTPVPEPPARYAHPFKARIMRSGEYPDPTPTLRYREPPVSGRVLAGVGEAAPRQVEKFFHAGHAHVYGAMELAFHMIATKPALLRVLRARWENRCYTGPVAIRQQTVTDPAAMSAALKAKALELGATLAGCTRVTAEDVYAGHDDCLPHAIVLAAPMDRARMLEIPSVDSGVAVIDGYLDVGRAAIALAAHIRQLGWRADADTNLGVAPARVLHIPLAVRAGLGQMGRHTSLITEQHGANVRLATVLTDIPLAMDAPVDIGVEDLCANCMICAENCPPKAIYPDKVMVRGVRKWHLDFDRCMPYFVENEACGICISVCPWSETDKGPLISLLQRHRRVVREHYPAPVPAAERLLTLDARPPMGRPQDAAGAEREWLRAIVVARTVHPGRIVELLLAGEHEPLPGWAPGAHTELYLPSGRIRAYSLSNLPVTDTSYRIAVKVEENGAGGSLEVETLRCGQLIQIKRPGNNFPLREGFDFYYLMAGGIGVTPLVGMAQRLRALGKSMAVHYSVKRPEHAIYGDELRAASGGVLDLHTDRRWLAQIFSDAPKNAAVYICGPMGYMDAVRTRALAAGLPASAIFREDFGSSNPDKPFDLVLASSGERIPIAPGQTIARVLRERGVFVPVSCGYGVCGTCTVRVLDGVPDPRDTIFSEEEKQTKITLCCSRSLTDELVIDL